MYREFERIGDGGSPVSRQSRTHLGDGLANFVAKSGGVRNHAQTDVDPSLSGVTESVKVIRRIRPDRIFLITEVVPRKSRPRSNTRIGLEAGFCIWLLFD